MKNTPKTISFFSRVLDIVAPRSCLICGRRLSVTEEAICTSCNMRLPRTGFASEPHENEMARLFWGRIPVERCAAWIRFEPKSQVSNIIYQMKYYGHSEIGMQLGNMVARDFDGMGFFEGINAILPIPLTRKRERQRGYNQSLEFARGVSEVTALDIENKAVRRKSFRGSQTRKDWWERQDNVEGVFELMDSEQIHGKHILIVDDVLTTGATVAACARELLKAEGVKISVLTLAFAKN
ncbi:MAG: ComF family protein [Prevotella sp.]|nr:ComF family protein [Prevotella sp.]